METITAPYGFVPLSDKVVLPEWLKLVDGKVPPLHDVPFEDGICGTLEIEIEAETPIFVRGTEEGGKLPFRLSDGQYAIPGTALRGALRNIVEIISFSRFSRVNNHRYAVRDLNNPQLYGRHMAEIVKGNDGRGRPTPLVNAGFLSLQCTDGEPKLAIEVCDFAKVEYSKLIGLQPDFQPGIKQSAVRKYNNWKAKLEQKANVTWQPRKVPGAAFLSRYGEVASFGVGEVCRLVFTGQPSNYVAQSNKSARAGNAKHHDFIFVKGADKTPIAVPESVFKDFEFAHSNRGQQNSLKESQTPNEEWKYWKARLEAGQQVPVFFLCNPDKSLRAFGLAMMFRLPYKLSIHEAVNNASQEHTSISGNLDFSEGLFGTVRQNNLALKGRVGISHALAPLDVKPIGDIVAVLGSPKASYYPNYVEQDPAYPGSKPGPGADGKPQYLSWMDAEARPRGWKRYKPLTETTQSNDSSQDNSRVTTTFRPLPARTKFRAHIDVHNVRPQELGALIWAVSLGKNDTLRHTLGMARPLGYGRCKMSTQNISISTMSGSVVSIEQCLEAFVSYMKSVVPGWESTQQIVELLALAKPTKPVDARYQRLKPNEFVEAKKSYLALPSAAGFSPPLGYIRVATSKASNTAQAPEKLATGSRIRASVSEEKTKSGKPKFMIPGSKNLGIVVGGNMPEDLTPGAVHHFEVKSVPASIGEIQLVWIDPDAPPVTKAAPKPNNQNRFGRR
jgi:CRISPR-associated protein (TIGR03986 family)